MKGPQGIQEGIGLHKAPEIHLNEAGTDFEDTGIFTLKMADVDTTSACSDFACTETKSHMNCELS